MRSLGARDAVNLDGGGSATMVIRGRVVNSPSDDEGERPVADSLEVVP
jgi:exopolysaccharide biosynthesis protein